MHCTKEEDHDHKCIFDEEMKEKRKRGSEGKHIELCANQNKSSNKNCE